MRQMQVMANQLLIKPTIVLKGNTSVCGDKSISHRALMLSALCKGTSHISNFLNGSDCLATLQILQQLGIEITKISPTNLTVTSPGFFTKPSHPLNCQNSGTTIRLLSGLLVGQNFSSELTGTEQICRRPMDRVVKPLKEMGANIHGAKNDTYAPLLILPTNNLTGKIFELKIASAQVKSCLLLAGLFADGTTTVIEPGPARDHTERMLKTMGAHIVVNNNHISIEKPKLPLKPIDIEVPGDISSAAFLIVAASIIPGSHIILNNIGVNQTRSGIIDALKLMNADITLKNLREAGGEPVADIEIKSAQLTGTTFSTNLIVRMIDEIPILAVAATQANGTTTIKDAAELKVKETNRIDTTVKELSKMGAKISATADGFIVNGPTNLNGSSLDSHGDHRLAMMGVIAGLCATAKSTVKDTEVIKDSFPGFLDCLAKLGVDIEPC